MLFRKQFSRQILRISLAVFVTGGSVHAELSSEAKNALFDLPAYAAEVKDAEESGINFTQFFYKSSDCDKLVQKGKQLGAKDGDMIRGNAGAQMKFGDAPGVCEAHRRWQVTLEAARYLHNFGLSAPDPATTKPGELGGAYGQEWSKKGQGCVDETKRFISKGAYTDKAINQLSFKNLTIRQALARCETMVTWGKSYAVETEKAKAAKAAAIRSKYVKAGFKGARLDQFIHYDNVQWKVAGCRNENNLQNLRKAAKLFQWLEHSDGTFGIRTFVFKGDKVVSITDDKFLTADRARAACN